MNCFVNVLITPKVPQLSKERQQWDLPNY